MIGKVWKILPVGARRRIVRSTQEKFTVSAATILINERREVLLLDHVLRPRSGWGLPGGFVDFGEQPEQTARREIREEIGIEVEGLRFYRIRTLGRHVETLYVGKPVGEARLQTHEAYSLGWFTAETLPEEIAPHLKVLLTEVLESEFECAVGLD